MATSQGHHVVVGGLGMLGRALQKQLLAQGKQVRVLDLAPSPEAAASRLVHPTSIEYVPCELSSSSSQDSLKECLRDAETVYSVVTSDVLKSSASDMKRTNVEGIQHLLEACSRVGVPKLVYASSVAVTNQLLTHREESEDAPLPEWETYKITYDRTKRQGEELVLQYNNANANFRTCSLRLGAILAGPGDYNTRAFLETPGRVYMPSLSSPTDYLSVHDIATAFVSASHKMDASDSHVHGKAINVTKGKNNNSASTTQVLTKFAEQLEWKLTEIPPFALSAMTAGYKTMQSVKGLVSAPTDETTPGLPFDLIMEAGDHEMTYDNSLAHKLLDYKPQETWEDAVVRIANEFREFHPELFK